MTARLELCPHEALQGPVAKLAADWKAYGSDTTFLRMLNHRGDLIPAFFDFYMRLRGDGLLPAKLKELVRLRIARLNTCRYCLGSLSPIAEKQGVTDRHIAELEHRPPGLFTAQELAAFDLAEAMWDNAAAAGQDQALRARLRQHFSDPQLLELLWAIGMYIGLGRMIVFSGIDREE